MNLWLNYRCQYLHFCDLLDVSISTSNDHRSIKQKSFVWNINWPCGAMDGELVYRCGDEGFKFFSGVKFKSLHMLVWNNNAISVTIFFQSYYNSLTAFVAR